MRTLYRATTEAETEIYRWSCWAEDRETAEAYTEDGVGHGGPHIREERIDEGRVLDIVTRDIRNDFSELAEALGYEDPETEADDWRVVRGWLYPWEESREIKQRLELAGYDWIRYVDDYPECAITWMRLG